MSKLHDKLFQRIANFEALRAAARKALIGKRKKPGAGAFCANLERELLRLERTLLDGSYHPGRYVEIAIKDPKEKLFRLPRFATGLYITRFARSYARFSRQASSRILTQTGPERERIAPSPFMSGIATDAPTCFVAISFAIFHLSTTAF